MPQPADGGVDRAANMEQLVAFYSAIDNPRTTEHLQATVDKFCGSRESTERMWDTLDRKYGECSVKVAAVAAAERYLASRGARTVNAGQLVNALWREGCVVSHLNAKLDEATHVHYLGEHFMDVCAPMQLGDTLALVAAANGDYASMWDRVTQQYGAPRMGLPPPPPPGMSAASRRTQADSVRANQLDELRRFFADSGVAKTDEECAAIFDKRGCTGVPAMWEELGHAYDSTLPRRAGFSEVAQEFFVSWGLDAADATSIGTDVWNGCGVSALLPQLRADANRRLVERRLTACGVPAASVKAASMSAPYDTDGCYTELWAAVEREHGPCPRPPALALAAGPDDTRMVAARVEASSNFVELHRYVTIAHNCVLAPGAELDTAAVQRETEARIARASSSDDGSPDWQAIWAAALDEYGVPRRHTPVNVVESIRRLHREVAAVRRGTPVAVGASSSSSVATPAALLQQVLRENEALRADNEAMRRGIAELRAAVDELRTGRML